MKVWFPTSAPRYVWTNQLVRSFLIICFVKVIITPTLKIQDKILPLKLLEKISLEVVTTNANDVRSSTTLKNLVFEKGNVIECEFSVPGSRKSPPPPLPKITSHPNLFSYLFTHFSSGCHQLDLVSQGENAIRRPALETAWMCPGNSKWGIRSRPNHCSSTSGGWIWIPTLCHWEKRYN